jgi:ABC-type transporter Mla MlaB component
MQVSLKTTAKKHKATLNGEIGFAETASLYETAQQILRNPKETQIDWSNLTTIHYGGLQVLFALRKSLEEQGCKVQFTEPDPQLYNQLHTLGVWDALIQS